MRNTPLGDWTLLAVFNATIVGSIVQPVPGSSMVLLGVIACAITGTLPVEKALSGYADKYVLLVLAVFFVEAPARLTILVLT